jgi:hypothetical protein
VSISSRREARLLTADERELVAHSHHPAIKGLANDDLLDVLRRLRERRDRARAIAQRQRRELSGRTGPSGARAASDDAGSRGKTSVLSAAVKRANKEFERRRSRGDQVAHARRALALKEAGHRAAAHPASWTPGEGMRSLPDEALAPSGALRQEGHEIARRRAGGPR